MTAETARINVDMHVVGQYGDDYGPVGSWSSTEDGPALILSDEPDHVLFAILDAAKNKSNQDLADLVRQILWDRLDVWPARKYGWSPERYAMIFPRLCRVD
jgi:hypothetical protein